VDLGGQDSKVVILDGSGAVADFAMNDKCAAGTGRFIEVMAGVLGVGLEQMGALSLQCASPVTINATCTVFAETEVISLIAQGRPPADIAAGIHRSIATRLAAMVRQLGGGDIFFCGGGARNEGVRAALKDILGGPLHVPPDPQFVVALGAALIAADGVAP
jgi:predicted CoA-substrate-specific enzyme activase